MIIAEIGSVHDGSLGNALKLVDLAAKCKADFVKFQYHIPDEETLKNAPTPYYFRDENRYEYFKRTEFNKNQWEAIIKRCKKNKIKFMCSVFSEKSLVNLIKLGVQNIKIPSGEITNNFLIKKINNYKNINLFVSTGMSSWKEIDNALKILKIKKIVLMQCTSLYPCPPQKAGLNIISEMKKRYSNKYIYGFSDHTQGNEAAILAMSLGAKVFEKHLTFSKSMYGSDAKFAMEPEEFTQYVHGLKKTRKILNSRVNKDKIKEVNKMKKVFEKKIILNFNRKKGDIIREKDLILRKSNDGIFSSQINKVVGKRLKKSLKAKTAIKLKHIC